MRVLLIAAAVAVAAACTPRDNRDSDLELEHAPEEAVYAEPTVTGGAYDSIIYRVGQTGDSLAQPTSPAAARGAEPAH